MEIICSNVYFWSRLLTSVHLRLVNCWLYYEVIPEQMPQIPKIFVVKRVICMWDSTFITIDAMKCDVTANNKATWGPWLWRQELSIDLNRINPYQFTSRVRQNKDRLHLLWKLIKQVGNSNMWLFTFFFTLLHISVDRPSSSPHP